MEELTSDVAVTQTSSTDTIQEEEEGGSTEAKKSKTATAQADNTFKKPEVMHLIFVQDYLYNLS